MGFIISRACRLPTRPALRSETRSARLPSTAREPSARVGTVGTAAGRCTATGLALVNWNGEEKLFLLWARDTCSRGAGRGGREEGRGKPMRWEGNVKGYDKWAKGGKGTKAKGKRQKGKGQRDKWQKGGQWTRADGLVATAELGLLLSGQSGHGTVYLGR